MVVPLLARPRRGWEDEQDGGSSSSSSSCDDNASTRRTAPRKDGTCCDAEQHSKAAPRISLSATPASPPPTATPTAATTAATTTSASAIPTATSARNTPHPSAAVLPMPPPPPPPLEHVLLLGSGSPSSCLGDSSSPSSCCSPHSGDEDASVSDVSTGSVVVTPRSLFKAYWDKQPPPAPALLTLSSTSTSASCMSSLVQHEGQTRQDDPSRFDYEDSLLLPSAVVEESPSLAKEGHREEQCSTDPHPPRRTIFGDQQLHRYRSYSEPSLAAPLSRFSGSASDVATSSQLSLGCFFVAPTLLFRKTRSASTLHDRHPRGCPAGASPDASAMIKRSCLRRGRFSSSLLSDMTATSAKESQESPDSPSSSSASSSACDQGSVTFNEDDNRVVVFDAPQVLWSQRGWSDYFAC